MLVAGATCQMPAIDSAMLLALDSWETDFAALAAMGRSPTMPTMQKVKIPRAMTTSIKLNAVVFMVNSFLALSCEYDLSYGLPQ